MPTRKKGANGKQNENKEFKKIINMQTQFIVKSIKNETHTKITPRGLIFY